MLDQEISGGFSAEEPLGMLLVRGREVLEAGSK
jgi:hypothetical protein